MSEKNIQIAVTLSAYDRMSAIFNQAVNSATAKLGALQKFADKNAQAMISNGRSSMMNGAIIAAPLIYAAKAYGDQEDALLGLKAAMMSDGGGLDKGMFNKLSTYAKNTSERLTGTTEDYLKMIRVLQENGIKPNEILGGIGDSVADLSVFFKMTPDTIGQFAARMRQDMGVLPKEMGGMMDMIARLRNAGVGKDGAEAVNEMSEAYSKAGLGAHNLGVQGLQASKDLGALMGIFIRRGISGGTVGNNFRRIFDGLRDADKMKKANEAAKQFGISLDFYDKNHKFKGIAAFAGEMNKLRGLNTTQISGILKPFSGKQGLSTDFLEFLGKEGTSSFNTMQEKLATQATLTQKVNVMMGGLNNQFTIAKTTAMNAAAAIGSAYSPELKQLAKTLNNTFRELTNFALTHKGLISAIAKGLAYFAAWKFATGAISIVSGSLLKEISRGISVYNFFFKRIDGVTKAMKLAGPVMRFLSSGFMSMGRVLFQTVIPAVWSAITATWAWTAALLANPITWIVLGILALAAAAILIWKNWTPISKWFIGIWQSIKGGIAGALAVMNLFMDVLIGAGKVFLGLFTFNPKLIAEGFQQSAKAVSNIMNGGISKAFTGAYNASVTGTPAKAVVAVKNGTSSPSINKASAGKDVFHFAPVIHINGPATRDDGKKVMDGLTPHLDKWYKDKQANERRISYK